MDELSVGRAVTPEQKREAVELLLKLWDADPQMRLGQLIVAALGKGGVSDADLHFQLFYMEDRSLLKWIAQAQDEWRKFREELANE